MLRLIDEEVELLGGDASKLIIGGISMGMATALVSMLVRGDNGKGGRLGGFVGASGWLPFAGVIQEEVGKEVGEVLTEKLGLDKTVEGREGELKGVPVFLGHGEDDAYVDFELGQKVRKVLEEKVGMKVVAKNYAGADEEGHWLKEPEEVEDIVEFLRGIVGEVEKEDGVAP